VLNPLAVIEEAQTDVLKPFGDTEQPELDADESGTDASQSANLETDNVE